MLATAAYPPTYLPLANPMAELLFALWDKTNVAGHEFVASCFPLRSGKESGTSDLCHIIAINLD
jgi:hypothetical protein